MLVILTLLTVVLFIFMYQYLKINNNNNNTRNNNDTQNNNLITNLNIKEKYTNYEELKKTNPKLLVETGYNPAQFTYEDVSINKFDKYSIKRIPRDFKEFTDVVYLGNPL